MDEADSSGNSVSKLDRHNALGIVCYTVLVNCIYTCIYMDWACTIDGIVCYTEIRSDVDYFKWKWTDFSTWSRKSQLMEDMKGMWYTE